jgi:hypothetical protein
VRVLFNWVEFVSFKGNRHRKSRGRIKIALETVDIPVQEEEELASNDDEVETGDVYVVECDAEEAIALSIAAGIPISIEKTLWESLNTRISTSRISRQEDNPADILPKVHVEAERYNSSLPYKAGVFQLVVLLRHDMKLLRI